MNPFCWHYWRGERQQLGQWWKPKSRPRSWEPSWDPSERRSKSWPSRGPVWRRSSNSSTSIGERMWGNTRWERWWWEGWSSSVGEFLHGLYISNPGVIRCSEHLRFPLLQETVYYLEESSRELKTELKIQKKKTKDIEELRDSLTQQLLLHR